eukprot:409040_1
MNSDESTVKSYEFHLDSAKQSYDPLGGIFSSLEESSLIQQLDVPQTIISIIVSLCSYRESTINRSPYEQTITSSPTKTFSECCLLINPPQNTKLTYIIRSFKYRCGYFPHAPVEHWPDNAKIYFQIELFDGTNHIGTNAMDRSTYNVLWKSKLIECGKVLEIININNLNVEMHPNQTYLLWVEVISPPFHAIYTE